MSGEPRLVLRDDPSKVARLSRGAPLTIGRAANNRLCLPTTAGIADHHAVVRHSRSHGWLVCDWGSAQGTFLEGQRLRQCRPLTDGDEIQLGSDGPVLVFQLPTPVSAAPPPQNRARPAAASARPRPAAEARTSAVTLGGATIALDQIRSAHVRSRPRYPTSFSWWVLASLGGLILLPWPLLFWPLELMAFVAWIVVGSRKEHLLIVTLRDGMAHRHLFANRITALSHRNGLRKAIGQSLESG